MMRPQIEIHSIVFSEGSAEIAFSEMRDQSPDIQVMKVLRLDEKRNGRQIAEMFSDLRDLVDLALVRLRDDPDELPGR